MSIYKVARQTYHKFHYHDVSDEQKIVDEYLNVFKKKYADVLSKESSPTIEKTLLIHSSHDMSYCMNIESIIAKKIQLDYGWKVIFLCTLTTINLAKKICNQIYGFKNFILIEDFMPMFLIPGKSEVLRCIENASDLKDIEKIRYEDVPVGIHSLATYSTTIPAATIELNDASKKSIKKLILNSMRFVSASKKIVQLIKPNLVLSIEKGTVGTCEIFYQSINKSIAYMQYTSCHEPNSIMLKRYNKDNQRMHPFSISDKSWNETEYNEKMTSEVRDSFENGYKNGDWFKYKNLSSNKIIGNKNELINILELDKNKKTAIIFSHVLNDANFFYGKDLFDGGFREWFVKTVEVASKNDQVNWLIKLHPANIFRRKNQGYTGEFGEIIAIKEHLGQIPDNIKIIPADIDINPFSFFMIANYGITVRGTVGAELPCFGIPVLTAGTGRYSNKGFTIDSATSEEYLDKIEHIHLIETLTSEQVNLANKHAYLFFKERPAKYDAFLNDTYTNYKSRAIGRDVEILNKEIFSNEALDNISSFFVTSSNEDYLNSKSYI